MEPKKVVSELPLSSKALTAIVIIRHVTTECQLQYIIVSYVQSVKGTKLMVLYQNMLWAKGHHQSGCIS